MTKITNIDKKTLQNMRPQIEEALAALGAELGVTFKTGSGAYGGNQAHFKLEIKIDDPEVQEAAAKAEFDRYCGMFGLEPEHFGTEFTAGGKRYRLTGLALNRSKYPLKVHDLTLDKAVLLTDMAVPHIRKAYDEKVSA